MKYFYSTFTDDQKSNITQIEFIKMSENEINTHSNLIDLTADGGNGMVKAWIENNKLYIASPGTTYFPANCGGLFAYFTNVTSILFNNVNTVNVTTMSGMFYDCSSLLSINLSNMGGNSLTNASMFSGCTNLSSVNMHGFNFGTSSLGGLFAGLYNLEIVDLSNVNISNVTNTGGMFNMDTHTNKLTTIYVSSDWNVDNITVSGGMFSGCTSLKGGGTPQTTYDSNHIDKEYARIDGGANSSTPGYLTLKTN